MNKIDIIRRCLDNTARVDKFEDMGILFFSRTFFPRCNGARQSVIHYKMMQNLLGLFNPKHRNRADRQIYITIFREGAKSTYSSFALPLFLSNMVGGTMAVRIDKEGWEGADVHDYDIFTYQIKPEFIEIFSETHDAAERLTSNIRTELETNGYLHKVFGKKTPKAVADDTNNIWRRDVFKLPNGTIIFGNGSGQQSRGMLIDGKRPTLAIFDDIYSKKNTLTETTREKIRYWFFAEAINSVDTVEGKVALIGTIMHEDTVFTDVKRSTNWTGYTYPAISQAELEDALKYCKIDRTTRTISLPTADKIQELEDSYTTLAWRERQDLYYLLSMYQEHFEMNRTSYFYQEKLNVIMSPEDQKYTMDMVCFTPVSVLKEKGQVWAEFEYNSYKWKALVEPIIGIDIASSEVATSDDTAIIVTAKGLAFPQLDHYDSEAGQSIPFKKNGMPCVVVFRSFLGKVDIIADEEKNKMGLYNVVEAFTNIYGSRTIIFEVAGQQGIIARGLRKYLRERKKLATVVDEPATSMGGHKEERINSILAPTLQSVHKTFIHDDKVGHILWSQLMHLGFSEHDDAPDAFATAIKHAKEPRRADYQQLNEAVFRYDDDRQEIPNWELV